MESDGFTVEQLEFETELSIVEELTKERDDLKSEVEALQKVYSSEKSSYKDLKDKRKVTRNKYESKLWERLETEKQIAKQKEDLQVIIGKLEESDTAFELSFSLTTTLENLKNKLSDIMKDRENLELERDQLQEQLQNVLIKLSENSEKSTYLFVDKRNEISILQNRYKSLNNIGEMVLSLYGEIEKVKKQIRQHTKLTKSIQVISNIHLSQISSLVSRAEEDRKLIGEELDVRNNQIYKLFANLQDFLSSISSIPTDIDNGKEIHLEETILEKLEYQLNSISDPSIVSPNEKVEQTDFVNLHDQLEDNQTKLISITKFQNNASERMKEIENKLYDIKNKRILSNKYK